MRRVLIVSPHFPPVNAPDMQRVRLALPHLRSLGWDPVVLAVEPASVEGGVREPILEETYPADIRVVRVTGLSPRFTRPFGFGSLWWRCGRALRKAGDALLAVEKFDLVFISTTQFSAFRLGPRWLKRFGVPYILDYQDPWTNDYYRDTATRPPGGAVKFWLSQFEARRHEPTVLRSAGGIIAVSAAYGGALQRRYPWFDPGSIRTLPFGSSVTDLEIAQNHRPASSLIPFGDGHIHHVYTGRCGPDMTTALTALFRAFKQFLASHPLEAARHRFHFIGTDYAPPPLGRFWAIPIAEQEGVRPYVNEHCYRVPYFDALYYLTQADALIIVGSNDPTYSASKTFPYLLAGRPLIVISHENGQIAALLNDILLPTFFPFAIQPDIDAIATAIHSTWFSNDGFRRLPPNSATIMKRHNAVRMTTSLVEVFDAALRSNSSTEFQRG